MENIEKKKKKIKERVYKKITIGEEDNEKKAIDMVREVGEEDNKEKDRIEGIKKEILSKKKRDLEYKQTLCGFLVEELKEVDWPAGYTWEVKDTDDGVAVMFKTGEGRFYGRGFKPCHELKYDLAAVTTLATKVENTIDRLRPKKTDSGIYIR